MISLYKALKKGRLRRVKVKLNPHDSSLEGSIKARLNLETCGPKRVGFI